MGTEKAKLSEGVQKYLEKQDWKAAVGEMEKLFALEPDPQIRVRMGDCWQKMNKKGEAVAEYLKAADLFSEKGFVVKALAIYKLILRIDPGHKKAQDLMAALHSNKSVAETKLEPVALGALAPQNSVIPLFSDMTQEEFTDFTKRMVFHTMPPNRKIIKEGESGASVFVVTRGSVRVYTTVDAKQVDLAVLQSSDFFGEIAFLTGKPRTATVETAEESDILEVSEEDLQDLIRQKPRIREIMQRYYEQRVASTLEKVKGTV